MLLRPRQALKAPSSRRHARGSRSTRGNKRSSVDETQIKRGPVGTVADDLDIYDHSATRYRDTIGNSAFRRTQGITEL